MSELSLTIFVLVGCLYFEPSFSVFLCSRVAAGFKLDLLPQFVYDEEHDSNPWFAIQRGAATLRGRAWKALQLSTPAVLTLATQLEFDMRITGSACNMHGLALVKDLESRSNNLNLVLAGSVELWNSDSPFLDMRRSIDANTDQWRHVRIPVGRMYATDTEYPYLGFFHDCDCKPEHCEGESMFANIRLFE